MTTSMNMTPEASRPQTGARRRYSAAYKQRILAEYEAADRTGKGALLRREGLCTWLISCWREERDKGALGWRRPRPSEAAEIAGDLDRAASTSVSTRP